MRSLALFQYDHDRGIEVRFHRFALAVLTAALTALAVAHTAAAATVEVSSTTIRAISSQELTFSGGGIQIACHFTLEGTLASQIIGSESTWVQIGEVTNGSVGQCDSSEVELGFLLESSWPVYARIDLPGPTITIRVVGARFLLGGILGIADCLYLGDVVATAIQSGSSIVGLEFATQGVPLRTQLAPPIIPVCPNPGQLDGAMTINPAIGYTLIL